MIYLTELEKEEEQEKRAARATTVASRKERSSNKAKVSFRVGSGFVGFRRVQTCKIPILTVLTVDYVILFAVLQVQQVQVVGRMFSPKGDDVALLDYEDLKLITYGDILIGRYAPEGPGTQHKIAYFPICDNSRSDVSSLFSN